MKKYPNFNREIRAVRLTNKVDQDVLDISIPKMYVGLEITNVYRHTNEEGLLTGNVVINGVRRKVMRDPRRPSWVLTVVRT